MRDAYGEMEMDGHDPSTVPRSERPSECHRDRGLLDLDLTAKGDHVRGWPDEDRTAH